MDFGAGGGAVGAMGNQGAGVDVMSWCVIYMVMLCYVGVARRLLY
jgi:hypothetical protein